MRAVVSTASYEAREFGKAVRRIMELADAANQYVDQCKPWELAKNPAGTTRLLAMRLADSGSGYNAQNDVPVHVGLLSTERVDVEITYPAAGRRTTVRQRNLTPRGQTIVLNVR